MQGQNEYWRSSTNIACRISFAGDRKDTCCFQHNNDHCTNSVRSSNSRPVVVLWLCRTRPYFIGKCSCTENHTELQKRRGRLKDFKAVEFATNDWKGKKPVTRDFLGFTLQIRRHYYVWLAWLSDRRIRACNETARLGKKWQTWVLRSKKSNTCSPELSFRW